MFSDHMGKIVSRDDRDMLYVRHGAVGHAVFGQHDHVRPGKFRVDFDLALSGGAAGDNDVCATIDITAYKGATILVDREVTVAELGSNPRTFSLFLTNREFRSLEYRVFSSGAAALLVGEPRLTRLGEDTGPPPAIDPSRPTDDPVELAAQVRKVLRLLRPMRALGPNKIRLGNAGDGGYVCLDDFADLDVALSLGINDDISWDLVVADRGLIIHQFDHTVDDPAPADRRMVFNKKMISAVSSDTTASLTKLVEQHDRGADRPNMMLKMDIEGGEWPVLEEIDSSRLGRFSQIVCELHCFDALRDDSQRAMLYRCLSKINEHYAVVHVHANICGGLSNIANVIVPNVIEFSFANRSLYRFEDTDELFPGPLDISCDAYQPDFWLGAFRF